MTQLNGDRHSGTLDGCFAVAAAGAHVRISCGDAVASTIGGQHLLWMLVDLLARQDRVVSSIDLAVPSVAAHNQAFLLDGPSRLDEALAALVRAVAGVSIAVTHAAEPHGSEPVSVVIGGTRFYGYGDDTRAAITCNPTDLPVDPPSSSIAIGPYFTACLLAGEVFKNARGFTRADRTRMPLFLSLWTFEMAECWAALPAGPETLPAVPPFYLVGGGAVGQAVIATLVGSAIDLAHVTMLDGDTIDKEGTNLNRYCLAVATDAGTNKALLLDRILRARNISSFAYPGTWQEYQAVDRRDQRAELRSMEAEGRFEYVISCVDKNPARHAIQRFWPRHLLGGSTLGLGLTVQTYTETTDEECLMCSNPIEADGWTIEGQADALANMNPTERRAAASRVGADIEAVERFLSDRQCGQIGQSEMHKFRGAA